jgi:glutamate transport system permease protein
MSTVLFDNPGPRTKARHRLYNILAGVVAVVLAAFVLLQFQSNGQLDYALWEPFVTPKFIQALLVDGLLKTVEMAFSAVILAVVLGLVLGLGKMSDHAWLRWPAWLFVEFFRAVPVLMLMIFIFFAYGAGEGGIGSYWSVVLALTLYNGSVLAEVFRAGVDAVPHGQAEAGYAIGLRKSQVMGSILLPQAVKIMLPAIVSQCVVALKDTTLGYVILAPGITEVGKAIYLEFHNQVQTALVMAAMFIALNLLLTWIAHWIQRRLVGEQSHQLQVPGDANSGAAV